LWRRSEIEYLVESEHRLEKVRTPDLITEWTDTVKLEATNSTDSSSKVEIPAQDDSVMIDEIENRQDIFSSREP
jgi:hypothetical protein